MLVHKFVCRGTVEETHRRPDREQAAAWPTSVLEAGGEALLTEMSDDELLRVVSLDLRSALDAA